MYRWRFTGAMLVLSAVIFPDPNLQAQDITACVQQNGLYTVECLEQAKQSAYRYGYDAGYDKGFDGGYEYACTEMGYKIVMKKNEPRCLTGLDRVGINGVLGVTAAGSSGMGGMGGSTLLTDPAKPNIFVIAPDDGQLSDTIKALIDAGQVPQQNINVDGARE